MYSSCRFVFPDGYTTEDMVFLWKEGNEKHTYSRSCFLSPSLLVSLCLSFCLSLSLTHSLTRFTFLIGDPVQVTKNLNLPRFTLQTYKTEYCTSRTNTG